jgi:hypothetical protein
MPLEPAARVDDPVTHSSNALQFTLAGIGILCTVTLITIALPEVLAATGVTGAVATGAEAVAGVVNGGLEALSWTKNTVTIIGNVASVLDTPAKAIDKAAFAVSASGQIGSGFPRVLLGNQIRAAARALSEDTKTKTCHVDLVFEGSKTVMLGANVAPMSRRTDRTKCGGKIANGLETVLVGGPPSEEGVSVSEADGAWLARLKILSDALGGVKDGLKVLSAKGTTAEKVLAGISATGQETSAVANAAGSSQTAKDAKTAASGASAVGNYLSSSSTAGTVSTSAAKFGNNFGKMMGLW